MIIKSWDLCEVCKPIDVWIAVNMVKESIQGDISLKKRNIK
jgi:hypothetical protein